MKKRNALLAVFAALALALSATPALAGKGGSGKGGHETRYGTLVATPSELHRFEYFDVSGCGYDTSLGNVILGYGGGGWGSPLDADGCFTITDIPASTLPGTYAVTAYQSVRNRWVEAGETTVTVLP